MDWQTPPACPTHMIPTAHELRHQIIDQRIRLDRAGARLDSGTDLADRAAARVELVEGGHLLASLEAQLAQVADDR